MSQVPPGQERRDLLFQDEIRDVVRRSYEAINRGAGPAIAERFYHAADLRHVPEQAIAWALGVGDPVRHAAIAPGESVLDLGCGGGIDTVMAAHRVGPRGRVVGVDMLPEMRDRARAAVRAAGVEGWCELEVGLMEAIPLPDASMDVVIANGVLNLSPRKSRVLAEVARVLTPGGRLCAADLTVDRELPGEVLASRAAWAGCIAGAVSERLLVKKLARAGFSEISLSGRMPFSVDDVAQYPLFSEEVIDLLRRSLTADARQRVAVGLLVQARRPESSHDAIARPASQPTSIGSGVTPLDAIAPATVEAPGVAVRHLKHVDDVELKVLDVEPGGSTPFHTHLHAHQGFIVDGRGELRLERRTESLEPGHVFTVDPNDAHAIASGPHAPLRLVCMDCFVE